jgi:hypothetical protein
MGLQFDPLTGTTWNLPEPATVTWYQQATAYAAMKWPSLAAHSRASMAESLATVTPALTRPGARDRPDRREQQARTALLAGGAHEQARQGVIVGHALAERLVNQRAAAALRGGEEPEETAEPFGPCQRTSALPVRKPRSPS